MMTPIAPHIEAFLREHLSHHRGASQHTCDSYGYSFQLLFEFAAARLGVAPSSLALEQLDAGLVSALLEYLEDTRRNAPETRNVRLAAIKSFFRFLEYRQPAALEQIGRVLAIPFKRTDTRLVPYLVREEVQALLDAPDPATHDGIRDRAMLHLAVCDGLNHGSCRRNAVATDRLTVRAIIAAKPRATAYLVLDGRGLYLKVQPGGARSWLVRYQIAGKVHDLGLGSYPEISLADARRRALEARRVKVNGADPLAARRAEREAKRIEEARSITFKDCAEKYIAAHEAG
jgi:integrase